MEWLDTSLSSREMLQRISGRITSHKSSCKLMACDATPKPRQAWPPSAHTCLVASRKRTPQLSSTVKLMCRCCIQSCNSYVPWKHTTAPTELL